MTPSRGRSSRASSATFTNLSTESEDDGWSSDEDADGFDNLPRRRAVPPLRQLPCEAAERWRGAPLAEALSALDSPASDDAAAFVQHVLSGPDVLEELIRAPAHPADRQFLLETTAALFSLPEGAVARRAPLGGVTAALHVLVPALAGAEEQGGQGEPVDVLAAAEAALAEEQGPQRQLAAWQAVLEIATWTPHREEAAHVMMPAVVRAARGGTHKAVAVRTLHALCSQSSANRGSLITTLREDGELLTSLFELVRRELDGSDPTVVGLNLVAAVATSKRGAARVARSAALAWLSNAVERVADPPRPATMAAALHALQRVCRENVAAIRQEKHLPTLLRALAAPGALDAAVASRARALVLRLCQNTVVANSVVVRWAELQPLQLLLCSPAKWSMVYLGLLLRAALRAHAQSRYRAAPRLRRGASALFLPGSSDSSKSRSRSNKSKSSKSNSQRSGSQRSANALDDGDSGHIVAQIARGFADIASLAHLDLRHFTADALGDMRGEHESLVSFCGTATGIVGALAREIAKPSGDHSADFLAEVLASWLSFAHRQIDAVAAGAQAQAAPEVLAVALNPCVAVLDSLQSLAGRTAVAVELCSRHVYALEGLLVTWQRLLPAEFAREALTVALLGRRLVATLSAPKAPVRRGSGLAADLALRGPLTAAAPGGARVVPTRASVAADEARGNALLRLVSSSETLALLLRTATDEEQLATIQTLGAVFASLKRADLGIVQRPAAAALADILCQPQTRMASAAAALLTYVLCAGEAAHALRLVQDPAIDRGLERAVALTEWRFVSRLGALDTLVVQPLVLRSRKGDNVIGYLDIPHLLGGHPEDEASKFQTPAVDTSAAAAPPPAAPRRGSTVAPAAKRTESFVDAVLPLHVEEHTPSTVRQLRRAYRAYFVRLPDMCEALRTAARNSVLLTFLAEHTALLEVAAGATNVLHLLLEVFDACRAAGAAAGEVKDIAGPLRAVQHLIWLLLEAVDNMRMEDVDKLVKLGSQLARVWVTMCEWGGKAHLGQWEQAVTERKENEEHRALPNLHRRYTESKILAEQERRGSDAAGGEREPSPAPPVLRLQLVGRRSSMPDTGAEMGEAQQRAERGRAGLLRTASSPTPPPREHQQQLQQQLQSPQSPANVHQPRSLRGLLRLMRSAVHGVEVRDRRYLQRRFARCFVGSACVTWILEHGEGLGVGSRDDALATANRLVEYGAICHVTGAHAVEDNGKFYWFTPAGERRVPRVPEVDSAGSVTTATDSGDDSAEDGGEAEDRQRSPLQRLALLMRHPRLGVQLQDRRRRLSAYSRCFSGQAAVQWLLQHGAAELGVSGPEEAAVVGQRLVHRGWLAPAGHSRPLSDSELDLFWFTASEELREVPEPTTLVGLLQAMRDPERGVELKTRRYRLSTYEHSFLGSDCVTFALLHGEKLGVRSRADALLVANRLFDIGFITHVHGMHAVEDRALFYFFTVLGLAPDPVERLGSVPEDREHGPPDLASLVTAMLEPLGGVERRTRRSGLRRVPNCASGHAITTWLCDHAQGLGVRSRDEAVALGLRLADMGVLSASRGGRFADDPRRMFTVREVDLAARELKLPADLDELVALMRDAQTGVDVRDRRYHLTVYTECFVGEAAVDWLLCHGMELGVRTRADAVALGQRLLDRGDIAHVVRDHEFKDAYLFYWFQQREFGRRGSVDKEQTRSVADVVDMMRSADGGVEVRDRRYRLHLFHACFVGSDAVDWLLEHASALVDSRAAAVAFGRRLQGLGILDHVVGEHAFDDCGFWYRFIDGAAVDDDLLPSDLPALLRLMRSHELGVPCEDRSYRLRWYPHCFTGSDAVDWILAHGTAMGVEARADAVELGEQLESLGAFAHVEGMHPFRDDYLYYAFSTSADGDAAAAAGPDAGHDDGPESLQALLRLALDKRHGVEVKDRVYKLANYPQCFVARELVSWLMRHGQRLGVTSREDATRVGRTFEAIGAIVHVAAAHEFADEALFFRFTGVVGGGAAGGGSGGKKGESKGMLQMETVMDMLLAQLRAVVEDSMHGKSLAQAINLLDAVQAGKGALLDAAELVLHAPYRPIVARFNLAVARVGASSFEAARRALAGRTGSGGAAAKEPAAHPQHPLNHASMRSLLACTPDGRRRLHGEAVEATFASLWLLGGTMPEPPREHVGLWPLLTAPLLRAPAYHLLAAGRSFSALSPAAAREQLELLREQRRALLRETPLVAPAEKRRWVAGRAFAAFALETFGSAHLQNVTAHAKTLSGVALVFPFVTALLLPPFARSVDAVYPLLPAATTAYNAFLATLVFFAIWRVRDYSTYVRAPLAVPWGLVEFFPLRLHYANWLGCLVVGSDTAVYLSFPLAEAVPWTRGLWLSAVTRLDWPELVLDEHASDADARLGYTLSLWLVAVAIFAWLAVMHGPRWFKQRRVRSLLTVVLAPIMSSVLYLGILSNMLSLLDCTDDGHLAGMPDVACWEDAHVYAALLGMLGLGIYFPSATMAQTALLFPHPGNHILYAPVYSMLKQSLVFVCLVVYRAWEDEPLAFLPLALLANVVMVAVGESGVVPHPCSVPRIRLVRSLAHVVCAWICLCALLAVALDGRDSSVPVLLAVGGVAAVALAARRRLRRVAPIADVVLTQEGAFGHSQRSGGSSVSRVSSRASEAPSLHGASTRGGRVVSGGRAAAPILRKVSLVRSASLI